MQTGFFFFVYLFVKLSFCCKLLVTGLDRLKTWFEYLTKCLRKHPPGGGGGLEKIKTDERHLV